MLNIKKVPTKVEITDLFKRKLNEAVKELNMPLQKKIDKSIQKAGKKLAKKMLKSLKNDVVPAVNTVATKATKVVKDTTAAIKEAVK